MKHKFKILFLLALIATLGKAQIKYTKINEIKSEAIQRNVNVDGLIKKPAPLIVIEKWLRDATGNKVTMRGVNVAPYLEGWQDDLDKVANAVASTKCNTVRLAWWSHITGSPEPQTGTTFFTDADFDRAITSYASKGILPIVTLHDLTGKGDSNQFDKIITAFWTKPSIVAIIKKHQAHLVINIANEWAPQNHTKFINTYKSAINKMRLAGITVPLMIDADNWGGDETTFTSTDFNGKVNGTIVSNGSYLINQDTKHNLLFAVHTYYWEYTNDVSGNPTVLNPAIAEQRLTKIASCNLPIIIGEMGNTFPQGTGGLATNYNHFLTIANKLNLSYLGWDWYNDGTDDSKLHPPFNMNITINKTGTGDGVTIPTTSSQNQWGFDFLNNANYGINSTAKKITFK